jgi:pilus assembly protein CpaE
MSSVLENLAATQRPLILIGQDAPVLDAVAQVFNPDGKGVEALIVRESIETCARRLELWNACAIVVDLGAARRETLLALQAMMTRIAREIPVVVLAETFDDALARWLLQIRVADFLRKPAEPREVLRACLRAMQDIQDIGEVQSQIFTFLPAAGGVGSTSLAIEAAMIAFHKNEKKKEAVCLIDLDFDTGACADYLDLEARLSLPDMGIQGERLDSGLVLFAAKGNPAARHQPDPILVMRLLDLIAMRYDTIIIDMPRWWEPWTDQVLMGANHVFITTDATVPGLRLGRRMAEAIRAKLADTAPRVIVNRFEQTMFGTGLRRNDIEKVLDGILAGVVSNAYRLVREAIDRGCPLEQVKAGNLVTLDLKKILHSE